MGVKIEPSFNRKGAEILFITPSGDIFAEPGIYTFMGYLMLFEHIGLDYTWSTYASEGGNFGFFTSHEMMKRLNAKMYAEAKRLGVKWILGGECGHMWRVVHQYMDTLNGPADFLEMPISPITGTYFENAATTKMVHLSEFTADLIKNNKLNLDPSQNDPPDGYLPRLLQPRPRHGPAGGAAIHPQERVQQLRGDGAPDHPRKHLLLWFGLRPKRRRVSGDAAPGAGCPRANAVARVAESHGVNMLSCVCAIDRAVFPALMDYWVPGCDVCGRNRAGGQRPNHGGPGPPRVQPARRGESIIRAPTRGRTGRGRRGGW